MASSAKDLEVPAGGDPEADSGESGGGTSSAKKKDDESQGQEKPKKREKRSYHYRNKKPSGMPKRPLSAYNYFFREQRPVVLANLERKRASGEDAGALEEGKSSNLFATMGKTIAQAWRDVTPEEKEKYKAMAAEDMKRYREEMDKYHKAAASKAPTAGEDDSRPDKKQKASVASTTAAAGMGAGLVGFPVQGDSKNLDQLAQLNLQQQLLQSRGLGNLAAGGMSAAGLLGLPSLDATNPAAMDSSFLQRQMLLSHLGSGMDSVVGWSNHAAYPSGLLPAVPGPSRLEQLLMGVQQQQQQSSQQASSSAGGNGDPIANSGGLPSSALPGGTTSHLLELLSQQQQPSDDLRLLLLQQQQQRRQEEQLRMQLLAQQQMSFNPDTAAAATAPAGTQPGSSSDQLCLQRLLAQQQQPAVAGPPGSSTLEIAAQMQALRGNLPQEQQSPNGSGGSGDENASEIKQG